MVKYTSVTSLVKHLQLFRSLPSRDHQSIETVGTGDNFTTLYWLDKIGILTASYNLYTGYIITATVELTEDTHYTLDLETSKLTLTSDGVSSVGTDYLYADYHYNTEELLNLDLTKAIDAAESKIELYTEQKFADATSSDPGYRKVVNEVIKGHYLPENKVYDLYYSPLVKIHTTVNGAYTTGGVTITLNDGSGLPNTGTIYIGGNKVTYTGRSGDDLTIPAATPSIDDDAVVRGEVIEISMEPESNEPSYTVLDPDTEYEIDYLQGSVKILNNAYFGEIQGEDRLYPSNYLVRASYFNAWHEEGSDPTIPAEIEEITNMMAAKKFMFRIVAKAHASGMNEFNPELITASDDEIQQRLDYYKPLNIGRSQADKQFLT